MNFNSTVDYILKNRLLKHFLFWFSYSILTISQSGILEEKDIIMEMQVFFLVLPVKMFFTYIVLEVLIPRFLLEGKFLSFLSSVFLVIPFAMVALRATAHFLVYPYLYPEGVSKGFFCSPCFFYGFFIYLFLFGYAASLKIFKHWYMEQKKSQKLKKEKLEAELKFLKAQIHPHFLFNTLNNLYALTLKKSDLAPEMVLKLSELLNYMLYECNAEYVSIEKELKLVDDYIELEKLRYRDSNNITIEKRGIYGGKQISPMLILPFVENAFKHGLSENLSNCYVEIISDIDANYFYFTVKNSKNNSNLIKKDSFKEGIGLQNVKRRLDLQYPNQYTLNIEDNNNHFKVDFKLKYQPN